LLPQIITNPRDSLSLARFMISLSKRKNILRTLSPDSSTSLRDSTNPRNTTMPLLSISRKIHRKVIIYKNNPQHRKIREEVGIVVQEEGTAIIMRVEDSIQLRMSKTRGDNTSPEMIAQLNTRIVIEAMGRVTLRRIRVVPQLRIHSTMMIFITRVLQAALTVHMIENLEVDLEVANRTIMSLVIQASEVEVVDAATKRMMKIITRVENPRKITVMHGDNLKKIPKKRQRVLVSKVRRPKIRRKTTMTTRREETSATRNLTGRERVETSTKSLAKPKKRMMSRESLLKSSRLSMTQRRETWQRLRLESMTRLLIIKRATFSKSRDQMRNSSKSTTK
jgi:hypothetical protein